MSDIKDAAGWVRELRRRTGLTQQELARRSGTSQPALARMEAGTGSPTVATLERLATAAGFELVLGLQERATADPVTLAYGQDLDRTLLRRNLRLTVDRRIRELAKLQEFDAEVRRAARRARQRR